MKKVLLVIPSQKNGGGVNVIANEIKLFFQENIVDVDVLFLKGVRSSNVMQSNECVLIGDTKNIFHKLINRVFLKKILRNFSKKNSEYDIVMTFGFLPSILAVSVFKCPVVITQHAALTKSFDQWLLKKYYFSAVRKLYPQAKKVITISTDMAIDLKSVVALANQQTLYNPLNFPEIKKKSECFATSSMDSKYFIYVGRLSQEKRVEELIHAFASYLKNNVSNPVTELLILGDGPERANLESLVVTLGLQSKVIFKGNVENPYQLIACSKALFLVSKVEGFPNVLVEAITLGVPVVSVDILSGPYEIIMNKTERTFIAQYPVKSNNGILLKNATGSIFIKCIFNAMFDIQHYEFSPNLTIIDRDKILKEYLKLIE